MEWKGRNEMEGTLGMNGVKRTVQKRRAAMRVWESVGKRSFSRAKCCFRSMVECSSDHFRSINEELGKSTRGNVRRHGRACAVKRVFKSMAMPPNDDHFEQRDLLYFVHFHHFAFFKNSCAEAVRAND